MPKPNKFNRNGVISDDDIDEEIELDDDVINDNDVINDPNDYTPEQQQALSDLFSLIIGRDVIQLEQLQLL